MSGTSSTVSWMVNSGAISTMPPTLAAAMIAMTKPMAVRSSLWWNSSAMGSLRRACGAAGGKPDIRHVRLPLGGNGHRAHRHPYVIGSDDGAEQEEQAAEGARDVVRIHGDERVEEGIGERSLLRVRAPHQTLEDAGVPHREHVDERPRDGEPEVHLDQGRGIHPLALPERGNQGVDRAEGDERDPTERSCMNMADGPVSVVRQGVDGPDRHERPLEGRQPVEDRSHHDEAQGRVIPDLLP